MDSGPAFRSFKDISVHTIIIIGLAINSLSSLQYHRVRGVVKSIAPIRIQLFWGVFLTVFNGFTLVVIMFWETNGRQIKVYIFINWYIYKLYILYVHIIDVYISRDLLSRKKSLTDFFILSSNSLPLNRCLNENVFDL